MSIKEKIEKNPWTYLISVASGAVIITFGVLQFLHTERISSLELNYQTKLDECNNAISSINRGLGNDAQAYFNVKKVFVKSTDKLEDASKLKFYNTDEFYTLSDSNYWKHEISYSFEGVEHNSKIDREFNKRDYSKEIEVLKKHKSKIHLWIGGKNFIIQNSSIFESKNGIDISTSLGFQKTNVDSLAIMDAEIKEPGHTEEFKKWYKKEGLIICLLTFIDQQTIFAKAYPETSFEIQDIQIQDNFIYSRTITTIKNALINYKKLENFYIKSETIGLLKNNDIYIITIVEPVSDILRSDPEITKWLNCLKIIVD